MSKVGSLIVILFFVGFLCLFIPRLVAPSDSYIKDTLCPEVPTNAFLIVSQPSDVYCYVDDLIDFSVSASGDGLSYLWYVKSVGQSDFKPSGLTGFNTNTLSVQATTRREGAQYRCLITDSYGHFIWSDTVRFYFANVSKNEKSIEDILDDDFKSKLDDSENTDLEAIEVITESEGE